MPGFNYGSSLTIEETAAVAGDKPRRLILVGPALPFMGAEWGFENRVVTEWYPGNAIEATQQTLGPTEMPSSWEGEWRRTMLGRAPSIYFDETGQQNRLVSPHVLRQVFEDIARTGVRLRVTWAVAGVVGVGSSFSGNFQDVDVQIIREGLVKSFKTPIDRHTDMKWSVQFEWASRGDRQDRVASVRRDQDFAVAADGVEQAVNATAELANAKVRSVTPQNRKSASHFTLGQLEAIANAPLAAVNASLRSLQQNVSSFKRLGDIARQVRGEPFAIANSALAFAQNTVSVAHAFSDAFTRTPVEKLSTKTRASSLARAARYFGAYDESVRTVARRAQELAARARQLRAAQNERGGAVSVSSSSSTRAGDVVAVHVCRQGDTPQQLSVRYYGSPDHGPDILRANRLPTYTPTLRPGQILVIPALVAPQATG